MKVNRKGEKKTIASYSLPKDYTERVYAGWLGKTIGVRHGGNIEQWSYDRIEQAFGEITGYLYDFKNFAADDDTNGPMFFLRSLEDYTYTRNITSEQMGLTWLNYAPDGHGFYWWGGYGKSTEHTAYLNLKHGIMAPRSGSIEQNGAAVAEQIGGQIFIDVWGLIAPGKPELAAEYAEKIASVSHDGNGKYGGMFLAACIAQAFVEHDMKQIMEAGLGVIPTDCEYAQMTKDVMFFHQQNPNSWRKCFQYVFQNYGYDRYPGACHIIPNAAVIILSLLYGEGDFSKTINICNMCGWDTDCNVGNVGTIMGVRNGLEGIDPSWRMPINDFLCCSSVIGCLNILDLPWCASYIARFGYLIAEEEPPEKWKSILHQNAPKFHFEYPGSTHAFRVESDDDGPKGFIQNTDEVSYSGERSLKVVFDYTSAGSRYRAFVKTYYRPDDFNDSRYDPSFSPILYPGQTLECKVRTPKENIKARLYVKDRHTDNRYYGEIFLCSKDKWEALQFTIPPMKGVCVEEAGIELIPVHDQSPLVAYIDEFHFSGTVDYEVDFSTEQLEKWHALHMEVSQLTYLRGIWTLEEDALSGRYYGEPAEAYTGDIQWRNYDFSAAFTPKLGEQHRINFRVQGAIRSYAVGLAPGQKLVLYKNENGYRELYSEDFNWSLGKNYTIEVKAVEHHFAIYMDGQLMFAYEDHSAPYLHGQIGFSNANGSHTHFKSFKVKGK